MKPSPGLQQKVVQAHGSYYSSLIVAGNVPGSSSWPLPAWSQVPLGSSRGKIGNMYMSGMLFISSLWEASELSQVFPKTTFFSISLKKIRRKEIIIFYTICHQPGSRASAALVGCIATGFSIDFLRRNQSYSSVLVLNISLDDGNQRERR